MRTKKCLNIDVSSFGKTRKQAEKNLKEALDLYLEDMPKSKITKVEQASIGLLKYA